MLYLDYQIRDEQGLHVRPISKIVLTLIRYDCSVRAESRKGSADGKDMMELMALGAGKGEKIRFIFEGSQEEEAYAGLRNLLSELNV